MAMKKMPGGGGKKKPQKMSAVNTSGPKSILKNLGNNSTANRKSKDPTYMGRDAKGGVVRKIQRGR